MMFNSINQNYTCSPIRIKKGVLWTPEEKIRFDRDNSRERLKCGRVDLYFKPENSYPARIYVFMHAEMWRDRNRRPMGLAFSHPFISRPMTKEEIEYHHFDIRLCYHQYESLEKLLFSEQCECDFLDIQSVWMGTRYMHQLKKLINKYPIGK